jgi:hypothetical protein
MNNEEFMKSPAGVVQELRGQYNAHIVNSFAHLGNYDTEKAQATIWELLCKAIIHEASVGEIVIEQHEGYLSPEPMFTVGTKSTLKAGTFYIVPKETHEGT